MSTPSPLFKVDYINPSSVMGMGIAFMILCPLFVGLRFYTRLRQKHPIMADDWFCLATLILTMGLSALMIVGASDGALGTPLRFDGMPTPEEIVTYTSPTFTASLKNFFSFQRIQVVTLGCLKLSFLFFYRRLFCSTGTKRGLFHYITLVAIAIIVAWTLAFFFAFLFSCGTNFYAQWGSILVNETQCKGKVDQPKLELGFCISDMIEDVFIVFLPIPQILHLQMSASRKLAVCGVFALGMIALVASMCRFAIFILLSSRLSINNPNPQYGFDQLTIDTLTNWWSMLESGLGLLAVCLPTLNFLFRDTGLMSRLFSSVKSFQRLLSSRSRGTKERDFESGYENMESSERNSTSISSRGPLPKAPVDTTTSYEMQHFEHKV